jgi:hypothetical protein
LSNDKVQREMIGDSFSIFLMCQYWHLATRL